MAEAHVNFLGGSPLNRLSWLRPSTPFLSAIVESPHTRWVLFKKGEPLVRLNADDTGERTALTTGTVTTKRPTRGNTLARLSTSQILRLLGPAPYFGQGRETGISTSEEESNHHTEAARLSGPGIVFLGLHEPEGTNGDNQQALPSSEFSAKGTEGAVEAASKLKGTPYFSLDVSEFDESEDAGKAAELKEMLDGATGNEGKLEFLEPRAASAGFTAFEAAVFAEARSMIDWSARNQFCPACGSPTYTLWAGWKRGCTTLLPWSDNTGKKPCPSGKGLNNFNHPRTDPVVIMAVIDESGEKALLGRNRKFPNGFYSTLAGFIEPGESFEDAVRREIWEEAGVRVWGVRYHSGQPWPYPASLMVGFYAIADSSKPVRTDLDNELVDARWFTREEVKAVLAHRDGSTIRRQEYKKFDDHDEEAESKARKDGTTSTTTSTTTASGANGVKDVDAPPAFRVPPETAIAGVLIRDWAEGRIGVGEGTARKGDL